LKTFLMLTLAFATVTGLRAADDDVKKLKGTWQVEKAELAGAPFPEPVTKTMSLILKDGEYTLKTPGGDDQGTVTYDAKKKPMEMDIKGTVGPNKGKTFLAIWQLDGDTLKVCYDLAGQKRPKEFKTDADNKYFLAVYKRKAEK
jgi:uncharacterized protein (TIGR03067 family)